MDDFCSSQSKKERMKERKIVKGKDERKNKKKKLMSIHGW